MHPVRIEYKQTSSRSGAFCPLDRWQAMVYSVCYRDNGTAY
jgi:hypothetical protein